MKDEKLIFWGFTGRSDIDRGLPKKGDTWTVCRFKGGGAWQETVGVLKGVDTPMHTMWKLIKVVLNFQMLVMVSYQS